MTDEIRSGAIPLAQYLEQQLPEYQKSLLHLDLHQST